MFLFDHNTQP